ncbi:MAG: DUF2333 family protein [Pseudomonadota bacterium]
MTRFFDWLVEFWDRLRTLFGLNRLTRKGRGEEMQGHSLIWRIFYFVRPVIALVLIFWIATMIWRFSWMRGEDLAYPQMALSGGNAVVSATEETQPESGAGSATTCAPSRIVEIEMALLDQLVNQNDWTPATPQYKAGFFFLFPWEATPFFDNKASFQTGALGAIRRVSIELTDSLGRVRGTSEADKDLVAARGRLQIDERTWVFNPFSDGRLPLWGTSAGASYADAIDLFGRFNTRLAACDALFDARADNLFQFLDSVTKDLGSTVDQIGKRSQGRVYDVATHTFVNGEGNNAGWFDLRADNLFHEARGRMYAYHGLMQGARADFADVIEKRDLKDVWDRMEARIAEAAVLSPWIVSNGREDGFMMPDHLSVMAENILRARANMTELRDILAR